MKRAFFTLSALCITAGAFALAGSLTPSTAATAGAVTGASSESALLRHLSGVVAVPPETMMRSAGDGLDRLWGPLNPPVFGPNVDASLNNSSNQNETTISIYPGDNQRVIASANDYRANLKPWVYLSTNGGTSWTNYQVPGTSNLFYGDPAMAFGPDHNKAYFSYLGYTSICSPMGGMYVSRSDDAGSTFSAPTLLLANTTDGQVVHFQDKEYVTVDKRATSPNYRNAYIGWTSFVLNTGCSAQIEAPVILSRSTDEGVSWSVPITVSPVISNNNQGTVPVTGNNGEVYVYYVGAATQSQLNYDSVLFSRSTDGGLTFPFFTHISNLVDIPSPLPGTQFRDNPFGAIAVDRVVNGYLYAVWADYRNGDADILLSRSTDNGTTWGPPQRVNDDSIGNGKDQYFPWIASSDDGLVHVTWHDEREDPGGAQYKAYYTYSSDHGATWATNIAVSTAPSNPGSSTFIGDYSGIDAVPGVVMPVWTDIRVGANQNAYTARGVKGGQATATPTPPQATPTASAGTPSLPSPSATVPTSTPTATATAIPTCGAVWRPVSSPNPGTGSHTLTGVSALSPNDVWAVGYYDNGGSTYHPLTLTMHWNGSQWSVVSSPNPGSNSNYLYAVSALSSNDVWAVGSYDSVGGGNTSATLTMHWNGTQWNVVSSPSPGLVNSQLQGVDIIAANDVWAVGNTYDGSTLHLLTMHWNGTQWDVVPGPNPDTGYLSAVEAIATNDVWAARDSGFIHWNGTQWSAVSASASAAAISGVASNDIWAVGGNAIIQHWNGSTWSVVSSPNPDAMLFSVSALSANDVWAVGSQLQETLTMHWNGSQWSEIPSPNIGVTDTLYGVSAISAGDVWAVGSYSSGSSIYLTLIERYYDPCVTPTPTHTSTPGPPTATSTACTISFTDVDPENTFYPYIRCLVCRGIISGYDDGTFRPFNDITRSQIAKIVSNAAGFDEDPGPQVFEDVNDTNPFYQYINRLSNRGHMGGYPCGTVDAEPCNPPDNRPYFRPFANATRGQLAKIVANAAEVGGTPTGIFYTDVEEEHPFYLWIMRLTDIGVMSGYDCGGEGEPCDSENRPYFRPYNNVTRGQASKIVANTFYPGCKTPARR